MDLRNRFRAVNSDENGAETVQVVLLTTFFVLVVAGVVLALKKNIDSVKVNESFVAYENVSSSSFDFGTA